MPNQKPETAESAAKEVTAAMQPVVTFNGFSDLKQPEPPVVKPLPAALAKALGQS